MKKIQNSTASHHPQTQNLKKTIFNSPTNSSDLRRDNSNPKFNRKPDLKVFQRKKPDSSVESEQRITYISPGKSNILAPFQTTYSAIGSPTFQDIAHRFSVSNQECFKFSIQSQQKQPKRFSESAHGFFSAQTSQKQIDDQLQISSYKMEIQKQRKMIEDFKKVNKSLKSKLKDFEGIQEFLMERESYITEINDKNNQLNSKIQENQLIKTQLKMELKKLQEEVNILRKEVAQKQEQFRVLTVQLTQQKQHSQQQQMKWQTKIETQKAEIELILKLNFKLNEELKLKSDKNVQNVFCKKSKQNNENVNRLNPRKIKKSKSVNFMQLHSPNLPIYKAFLEQDSQSNQQLNSSVIEYNCPNEQSYQQQDSILNESMTEKSQQNNLIIEPKEQITKDFQRQIKKLKQKVRYGQIQIDILKRLKLDCAKMRLDNQKYKKMNRKLLSRVEYLTQNYCRRGKDSDSSLELSLSPKRS